jgi:flagellar hook-associated protein 2
MTTINSTSSTGTVSFSGLASGIDTASIVDSLIEVESAPKTLLEDKVTYLETKQTTYEEFNTLLEAFYDTTLGLNSSNDINTFEVSNGGSSYFSISTTSLTTAGSYSVEVVSLAQQQKDISTNYVADTDTTTLSGELQLGEETLSYEDTTLEDLVTQINEGDYGVTASVVNDGSGSGYRLMLTGDTAGEELEIVGTGDITLDTSTDGHTVEGTKAQVKIDGVTYYSSSNTISSAIKGATITLSDTSDGDFSKVTIESSADETISTKLQEMVDAYNAVNEYIDTISASDSTLANTMKSVQRSLRNYLTGRELVNLGISTDWETGELSFDSETFSEAYEADSEGVITNLFGDDDTDGVLARLDDYLAEQTNATSGFFATKDKGIDDQISRLEDNITAMETRLEKRRETLEAQFSAMEELISSLNSNGDYLTSFFEDYSSS